MRKRSLLLLGCIAVMAAAVVGVVLSSLGWFAAACLGLGILIDLVIAVGIYNDAPSRRPDEVLLQQMTSENARAENLVALPTDAATWRPMILGLPALLVGVVSCLAWVLLSN
jgi:hypothetical protein